ncbi:MAG TPA: hypothetical protein VIA18_24515, partial [Polyangia bacterium]|nr:hypothetical protein [Polyangia bacterium]
FQIGFGGHQSWEAHHVSALYHENTMDEQRTFNQAFRGSSQMLSNGLETGGGAGPKGPGPD